MRYEVIEVATSQGKNEPFVRMNPLDEKPRGALTRLDAPDGGTLSELGLAAGIKAGDQLICNVRQFHDDYASSHGPRTELRSCRRS